MGNIVPLVVVAVVMASILGGITLLTHVYSLNGIKNKTVGNGQHGTARWATKKEIHDTYVQVPFNPKEWRKGNCLPTEQGYRLCQVHRLKAST